MCWPLVYSLVGFYQYQQSLFSLGTGVVLFFHESSCTSLSLRYSLSNDSSKLCGKYFLSVFFIFYKTIFDMYTFCRKSLAKTEITKKSRSEKYILFRCTSNHIIWHEISHWCMSFTQLHLFPVKSTGKRNHYFTCSNEFICSHEVRYLILRKISTTNTAYWHF